MNAKRRASCDVSPDLSDKARTVGSNNSSWISAEDLLTEGSSSEDEEGEDDDDDDDIFSREIDDGKMKNSDKNGSRPSRTESNGGGGDGDGDDDDNDDDDAIENSIDVTNNTKVRLSMYVL